MEEKLLPLVLSALDEDSQTSRLFACRSLSGVIKLTGTSLHPEALNKIYPGKSQHTQTLCMLHRVVPQSELNNLYPLHHFLSLLNFSSELLKRLDDSSEEVRSVSLQALGLWFSCLTKDYNPEFYSAHLQLLFQQLLLHLDDPDGSVQDHVLGETGWGA